VNTVGSEQRSASWFQERCGSATGSHAADIMNFLKNGKESAARAAYRGKVTAELLSGMVDMEGYKSPYMDFGSEHEDEARAAYELQEGCMVEEVGFLKHPTIPRCGGSCDGIVGEDGIVELKVPATSTHLRWILDGVVPPEHEPQMSFYLAVTGRKWCDFASYDPRLPKQLRLMVIRLERNEARIAEIEEAVRVFNAEVDAVIERLRAIVGPFDLPAAQEAKAKFTPEDPAMAGAYLQDSDFEGLV
jgi:hypothetical protein